MLRRTTIEIDQELLERAKLALGEKTTRATVEEALRQVSGAADAAHQTRTSRQRSYLDRLDSRVDLRVLASEEMWR